MTMYVHTGIVTAINMKKYVSVLLTTICAASMFKKPQVASDVAIVLIATGSSEKRVQTLRKR